MAKFTVGANAGVLSVSKDVEIKNPIKMIKEHCEKKKQEEEENKIQDLKIGFWLPENDVCVEMAVVHRSRKEVRDRLGTEENIKDPLKLLFRRANISDFFSEDEFVEKPQDLSGYENHTKDDFDFNYFI